MHFANASHRAERFLPLLNGMLRMRFSAFQGLKLKGILGIGDNGQWMPFAWTSFVVVGLESSKAAERYLAEGGPTLASIYELARADSAVAEALLYFGRAGEPFFDLYKAFEVVSDSVGGEDGIQALGISKNECRRFTRAANDPELSGVVARHSKRYQEPAGDPMNEHRAREFVGRLLDLWTSVLLRGASGKER
jgi:hypothetical protein